MKTIADVLARMNAIEASLAPSDGVGCFNRLYRRTTQNIAAAISRGAFELPGFVEALDVHFAALYFEAWDAAAAGQPLPRAWAPLFERRAARVAPLQFALAGMNAHINRDLAIAVTRTCAGFGVEVESDTPWHRDFMLVNRVLRETREGAKTELSTGIVRVVDRALGDMDDRFAMWTIARARDAAEADAEVLDALQGRPELYWQYVAGLDHAAGVAGRALLAGLATPGPRGAMPVAVAGL